MTCSVQENVTHVTWLKTEATSNATEERHVMMGHKHDGTCGFFPHIPPNDVDCACVSQRVFTCKINHVTDTEHGDRWRCEAKINNQNMSSQDIQIYVHGKRSETLPVK
ncbi:hypothetical protein DPMN_151307 [Dreissena polymorpha]|uniref:Ig-like domain-containing protein n=1 Tax=Dreissena polymorpha TaxID=45954 RepID=A0A9D4J2U3_DREPO|nr:hypothetical protein DPMN_151307 [Dreissena polymorpha]